MAAVWPSSSCSRSNWSSGAVIFLPQRVFQSHGRTNKDDRGEQIQEGGNTGRRSRNMADQGRLLHRQNDLSMSTPVLVHCHG